MPIFQIVSNNRVRLLKDWVLNESRTVPCGFESDLGSVPRFFWWFLHPNDITYSSIIHDYEWLLSDLGKCRYHQGNLNFLKNSIQLDKIEPYKAYICYVVLEIIRIYKWMKYRHE